MSFSVIIPFYRWDKNIEETLEKITGFVAEQDEIILVKDGDFLDKKINFPQVKLVNLEKKAGPGEARNRGAKIARGEILLFLDSDVEPEKNFLPHLRNLPTGEVWQGTYILNTNKNICTLSRQIFKSYAFSLARKRGIATLNSFCFALHKDDFLSSSGFSSQFLLPGSEDTDLGFRLKERGMHLIFKDFMEVKHKKVYTLFSLLKEDFRKTISKLQLFREKRKISISLNPKRESIYFLVSPLLAGYTLPFPFFFSLFFLFNLPFFHYMKKKLKGGAFVVFLIYFLESVVRLFALFYGVLVFLWRKYAG